MKSILDYTNTEIINDPYYSNPCLSVMDQSVFHWGSHIKDDGDTAKVIIEIDEVPSRFVLDSEFNYRELILDDYEIDIEIEDNTGEIIFKEMTVNEKTNKLHFIFGGPNE